MDSNFDKDSRWEKISNFDPIPNEGTPVAPMQTTVATPAVAPREPISQPQPVAPPIDYTAQMKKSKTLSIIFTVVGSVFFCLGIVSLVIAILNGNKASELEAQNAKQQAIISAISEEMGANISDADNLPTFTPTTGHIYLSNWHIKIKIPDELSTVSYILNENYRPKICFNAVTTGVQYFPAFADITKNPGGMGCLTRVATSEGTADSNGDSFGEQVFTGDDGYNYFYTLPGNYSSDAAELGIENTTIQTIKSMLSGNVSIYH